MRRRTTWRLFTVVVCAGAVSACGGSDSGSLAAGGSGAASGVDGAAGSGGSSGRDGSAGSGATAGSGGSSRPDGSADTGGTGGAGASGGLDGSAGSGGSGGADGGADAADAANATDAADAAEAGPCTDGATQSCSSAPAYVGIGVCKAGLQTCVAGAWGPCVGEITPSGEACNGKDDDCNNQIDDGLGTFTCGLGACKKTITSCSNGILAACVPGVPATNTDGPTCNGVDDDCDGAVDEDCKSCIPVSLTGNDATATGAFTVPFKTIQAAISYAVAHSGPKTVCVAAGAACGTSGAPVTGTYANAASTTVTMADGVSVYGNYESTQWTRCASSTTTVIQPQTPEGVTFPSSVASPTVLDGFKIDRFNSSTTAGVTVNGAQQVVLSNLAIQNTPAIAYSYGINLVNGGEATVTQSHIDAGAGTVESIGIRSIGSKLTVMANCLSLDATGHCDDGCGNNPSIRGRTTAGTGDTYAVQLVDSPNSRIESSALCAVQADHGAILRITGQSDGIIVRANNIAAFGGVQDSHGIWLADCNDAKPWIVDNFSIMANGVNAQSRTDGVRAEGACHPVIDSNVKIAGGGEGQASNTTGVHCLANASGVPSKCVVLSNALIRGSTAGFPPVATGVRCDDGSCNRIADNQLITGRGGLVSYGVYVFNGGPFVDNNVIQGGCSGQATGLYADDAFARVQNNRVFGYTASDCGAAGTGNLTESRGMWILTQSGNHEIDVHSNDIDGAGTSSGSCTSWGVELSPGAAPPSAGVGIFRNSIIRAGACSGNRYGFYEAAVSTDPRIFENNDLDPYQSPTALYFDEAATAVNNAAAVNALTGMTVSGVISADAQFVSYPTDLHLTAGSPCDGAGTPAFAPAKDMDGQTRSSTTPDIGADEL